MYASKCIFPSRHIGAAISTYTRDVPPTITLPPPIPAGPLATLARQLERAYTPGGRPSGKAYDRAAAAAAKLGAKTLVAALDDAACTLGRIPDKAPALAGKAKKEYSGQVEVARRANATRVSFLHWLTRAVVGDPKGRARLLAIAGSARYAREVRRTAADAYAEGVHDRRGRLALAKVLDVRAWDAKDLQAGRLYRAGLAAWNAADPRGMFTALHTLCTPAAIKRKGGQARAEAIAFALDDTSDPRWAMVLAGTLATDLDMAALMTLERLPREPRVLDAVLAYLERGYFHDSAVELVARLADVDPARTVPMLARALADSWMHYARAFAGFAKAGDPSAIAVIEAWLVDNSTPERVKEAKAVIRALGGAKAKARVAPRSLPTKPAAPAPTRPTLVYAKIKPTKRPKLPSVAKLEADYRALFAQARIAAHYDALARRAVWLHPTRVDEATVPLGATKLGGHPDLPAGTAWPRVKKAPLTFLAQLDLAALAPHLPAKSGLPRAGRVALFVDEGMDAYCERAVAIATPPGATLVRHEVPDDYVGRIYQCATVEAIPTVRLPSPSHPVVTATLDDDEQARYADAAFTTEAVMVQVLGYRDHGYEGEVPANATLLLQLPGDAQTGMEFGDVDVLGLYVPTQALAKGDFRKLIPKLGD